MDLVACLFSTRAIRACVDGKPFWLTSGKIGGYFINSEYLYGDELCASTLLADIDNFLEDKLTLPANIYAKLLKQYLVNPVFEYTINQMKERLLAISSYSEIDFISGGQRRDWIFSMILASQLNKPHITLFKDKTALISDSEFKMTEPVCDVNGKKILHISDLITEAASYLDYWIPTINKLNGKLDLTLTVVNRMQGGENALAAQGVRVSSMLKVDRSLFSKALNEKMITKQQFDLIEKYIQDPYNTMRNYLLDYPEFLRVSLNSNGKTKDRAQKCINQNIYDLPKTLLFEI